MKRYKGLGRVFSFTLTQQLRQRGWRTATIAVALACLLIPILSLTVAAQHQKNAAPEQNPVMEEGYTQEALDRAELTPEQRVLLTAPVEVTVTGGQTGEGETMGLLSMLLPFASLMLLYFLVLLYGQSTAASVILEKTSKLMDLFLVSVEPGAMVLGKVLATALAGLLQLAVWAAGLAGGFAIGGAVVRQTGVTLPLLEVLKGVGRLTGLFSVPAMLEAAGLLLAGFLLYCSLSAIGRKGRGPVQHQRAVLPGTGGQLLLLHVRRGHGRHDLLGPVAGLCPLHRHSGDAQPGAAGADLPAGGPGVPGAGGGVRRGADGPGGPGIPADVPV